MATALLFDLDGTLADTDALHLVAFQQVFARHGVGLTRADYIDGVMGNSNPRISAQFLPHLDEDERAAALEAKEALFRDALGALEPVAGVVALLDFAQAHDVPCAIVTNAPRANAVVMLEALGLTGRLPLRIIGHELARAKPDPLPYLTGLELTGADAAHSVAFEDSLSGLRAAVGAGLAVVGLTTTLDQAALLGAGATIAVADFTDRRIYELLARKMACSKA